MTDGEIPFSEPDYDKLDMAVFPTIRRRDKYGAVGDVNDVTHGKPGNRDTIGQAEIIAKETVTLSGLNSQFFKFDTQTQTLEGAYESINSFYRNPIGDDEQLTLYWNKWVSKDD